MTTIWLRGFIHILARPPPPSSRKFKGEGADIGGKALSPKENTLTAKEHESTLKGRDARTGQFIPVEKARKDPDHTTVERVGKAKK